MIRRLFRYLLNRPAADADLDEELKAHIALERQRQEEAIRGKQKSQLEGSATMLQTNLDESRKVLDNLLVRGVVRWRWLTVTTVHAFVAATFLVAATGGGLWTGAQLVDAPVTASQVVEPMAGTLPLVALFTGIAVLVFGIAPRLTTAVPVTRAVIGYLLDIRHAAQVAGRCRGAVTLPPPRAPSRLADDDDRGTGDAAGVIAAGIGIAAFARRDLRGA